jgi:hypothetical protein
VPRACPEIHEGFRIFRHCELSTGLRPTPLDETAEWWRRVWLETEGKKHIKSKADHVVSF